MMGYQTVKKVFKIDYFSRLDTIIIIIIIIIYLFRIKMQHKKHTSYKYSMQVK